ncbi:AbrB/MazE/SpoVT family DNA-binding domain-containing protein [Paenibacillus kandeliae]|uniref:AbrB/MazE/SpoVT family DNA-binding domain-containing protein n=1 Tax=Paenibacillus kandeliae TaxID=3231269 RepID=UPI0034597787
MPALHQQSEELQWKRARVSAKRQVTIPQKLYEQVGIQSEVEFAVQNHQIIMRPVKEYADNDHFADLILEDLLKEGVPQDQLVARFRERQQQLSHATQSLIKESRQVAQQYQSNDATADLFGDVMED